MVPLLVEGVAGGGGRWMRSCVGAGGRAGWCGFAAALFGRASSTHTHHSQLKECCQHIASGNTL